ncbi:hypothetical protein [Bacillus horti]|uniref:Lipoprotein n=1 Tax=Caldalkalibacillus horti TaxID=77523 RepID=A0ABT9VXB3_9BACI|nr:hypothetical protein [Bacillus horti]MDQ0165627.1 hypothetical protein [Bacillus horti]
MLIRLGKYLGCFFALLLLTSCASYLNAEPEQKLFKFDGKTLNVVQNDIPTDLFVEDRPDVKVVRRIDVKNGTLDADWTLENGTLNLQATCYGLANCDARFEVYVPHGVKVFRNGNPTQINGDAS